MLICPALRHIDTKDFKVMDRGFDRDRRRSRSRDRSRSREKRYDRDRDRGRDRERPVDASSRKSTEKGWERSSTGPDVPISQVGAKDKTSIDQLRKERLALVKKLTQGEDEPPTDNSNVITLKIKPKVTSSSSLSNGDKLEDGEQQDDDEDEVDYTEEDMMAMMGFNGFNTTKDKPHEENKHSAAVGAVSKHKARKYRQYMNRKGGFNRPLQHME